MVRCTSCQAPLFNEFDGHSGSQKSVVAPSSVETIQSVSQGTSSVIYDSGYVFCGDECAPRELREDPPEKTPLHALIEFFHSQNTDTSRSYYNNRGWDSDVIDEFYLGWAPADELKAYNYLSDEGYSTAEILSTGLFIQEGTPPYDCLWRGRYVFPYFDKNKHIVYAISRSTGSKGGGGAGYDGHPADIMSGKYAKLPKNKPFSIYEEPIYGTYSLSADNTDVIIAEGIADAISAINHGYATVSPVTTQFSYEQYTDVAEIVSDDFECVYIVPDNEPIQESQDTDISVGLEGGLKTAAHLRERDISADIKIVELPRDSDEKMDLDKYLSQADKKSFENQLDKANDPDSFSEFEKIQSNVQDQIQYREQSQQTDLNDSATGEYSAIYDLSVIDVLPDTFSRRGDRGANPISHTGHSRNYFAIGNFQGDLLAHDFKRNTTYNALTYILCELGERDLENPTGSLSNREIWKVWKWCKENNIIPDEDPVPSAAIAHLAEEIGYEFSSSEEKKEGYVPYDIYQNVLSHITDKYNLSHGRE